MKRTSDGTRVLPLWLVFLIGGTFKQENGGYATYPGGVVRQTLRWWKYFRGGNPKQAGRKWWSFVDPRPTYGFPGGPIHKQRWF